MCNLADNLPALVGDTPLDGKGQVHAYPRNQLVHMYGFFPQNSRQRNHLSSGCWRRPFVYYYCDPVQHSPCPASTEA